MCATSRVRGAALALALLCLAALAPPARAAEMSPAPFMLSSRFGRSPPRLLSPRTDRFIVGSRFGKRSEGEVVQDGALAAGALSVLGGAGPRLPPLPLPPALPAGPTLVCEPAAPAHLALYRCRPDHSRHRIYDNRRSEEDPLLDEE